MASPAAPTAIAAPTTSNRGLFVGADPLEAPVRKPYSLAKKLERKRTSLAGIALIQLGSSPDAGHKPKGLIPNTLYREYMSTGRAESIARTAEVNSGWVVTEAKYCPRAVGVAMAAIMVGRTAVGLRRWVGVYVVVLYVVVICVATMYVVVVCALARRKRVKTMKMGVKNMVAVGLRWLVYERM